VAVIGSCRGAAHGGQQASREQRPNLQSGHAFPLPRMVVQIVARAIEAIRCSSSSEVLFNSPRADQAGMTDQKILTRQL
jgi:hypothetical protein